MFAYTENTIRRTATDVADTPRRASAPDRDILDPATCARVWSDEQLPQCGYRDPRQPLQAHDAQQHPRDEQQRRQGGVGVGGREHGGRAGHDANRGEVREVRRQSHFDCNVLVLPVQGGNPARI